MPILVVVNVPANSMVRALEPKMVALMVVATGLLLWVKPPLLPPCAAFVSEREQLVRVMTCNEGNRMSTYRPKLMEARDAVSRMDALCEFIEFWLGPRQQSYGEPARALRARSLPMPLERLYEFAGRWPSWEDDGPMQYVVPALSRRTAWWPSSI